MTVASNPEFLKEGVAVQDAMNPDRIIVGLEDSSVESDFRTLYKPFIIEDLGKLIFMIEDRPNYLSMQQTGIWLLV